MKEFYARHYKKLMLIPLLSLLLSVAVLVYTHQRTGEWFQRSADLRGGTQLTLTVEGDVDARRLQGFLEKDFGDASVREIGTIGERGLLVSVGNVEPQDVVDAVERAGVDVKDFSYQQIGPSLGEAFWRQSQLAFVMAFVFMAVVVFLAFRTFVPSVAVIQAAVTDIVGALAVMQLVGIELSLASFAALMLIIGYSVDTDILLTTRMLKRSGDSLDLMASAMKTGLTMTLTALIALTALYVVATASTLSDIAAVLVIALLIDIPATYLMNGGMLRWWLEKRRAA